MDRTPTRPSSSSSSGRASWLKPVRARFTGIDSLNNNKHYILPDQSEQQRRWHEQQLASKHPIQFFIDSDEEDDDHNNIPTLPPPSSHHALPDITALTHAVDTPFKPLGPFKHYHPISLPHSHQDTKLTSIFQGIRNHHHHHESHLPSHNPLKQELAHREREMQQERETEQARQLERLSLRAREKEEEGLRRELAQLALAQDHQLAARLDTEISHRQALEEKVEALLTQQAHNSILAKRSNARHASTLARFDEITDEAKSMQAQLDGLKNEVIIVQNNVRDLQERQDAIRFGQREQREEVRELLRKPDREDLEKTPRTTRFARTNPSTRSSSEVESIQSQTPRRKASTPAPTAFKSTRHRTPVTPIVPVTPVAPVSTANDDAEMEATLRRTTALFASITVPCITCGHSLAPTKSSRPGSAPAKLCSEEQDAIDQAESVRRGVRSKELRAREREAKKEAEKVEQAAQQRETLLRELTVAQTAWAAHTKTWIEVANYYSKMSPSSKDRRTTQLHMIATSDWLEGKAVILRELELALGECTGHKLPRPSS